MVYHTTKDPPARIGPDDEELLRIITNNARMQTTQIARRLKTTPRVVRYRIDDLERKGVILGYKAHLDPKTMGNIFCKAIIYLTNADKRRIEAFIAYASSQEGAVWPQRVLGAWDFEIDFELPSYDAFQEALLGMKERFPDIIKDQEFVIASKEYKLSLFPRAYPEER
jgi:Lrp/AsnC family transcriptional regulator for asnA, asnC and gidA